MAACSPAVSLREMEVAKLVQRARQTGEWRAYGRHLKTSSAGHFETRAFPLVCSRRIPL